MTSFRKKPARPPLHRWLWSNRATIFIIPLIFGSGSQLMPTVTPSPAVVATVEEPQGPFVFTITRIPNKAPSVATILANARQRSAPELNFNGTEQVTSVNAVESSEPVVYRSMSPDPPLPPRPQALPDIDVRVGIIRKASRIVVETETEVEICDRNHTPITTLSADQKLTSYPTAKGLTLGDLDLPKVIWLKPKGNGLISLRGRWYRGTIQLIWDNHRLLAVNHLDLEPYLYGVVGSEMPALWPMDALKAQAITARSYALSRIARPFSRYYDLGATPRWQAYKGTTTETESIHTAVDSTQGLVLGYDGSIVESLYAATERLVRNVHRGYGMSQNGARQLAQRDYPYWQILDEFYPGTDLIWLSDAS